MKLGGGQQHGFSPWFQIALQRRKSLILQRLLFLHVQQIGGIQNNREPSTKPKDFDPDDITSSQDYEVGQVGGLHPPSLHPSLPHAPCGGGGGSVPPPAAWDADGGTDRRRLPGMPAGAQVSVFGTAHSLSAVPAASPYLRVAGRLRAEQRQDPSYHRI